MPSEDAITGQGAGPPIRRWRVLLPSARKTLFHLIRDERLEIQHAYDPTRPPHLIVLACPKMDGSFAAPAETLPAEAWRSAGVIFDASGKGARPTGKFVRRVSGFISERGVPEARCAFVTNNRRATLKGLRIRIVHYDYWVRRLFSWSPKQGRAAFEERQGRFRARAKPRPRRFLSFNLTARRWKLLFLLSLLRDGLWEAGYVSFGGFEHLAQARGGSLETVRRELETAPDLGDAAVGVIDYLPALDAKGQILFGDLERTADGPLRKPTGGGSVAEYDLSWFSATTETEMSSDADCVTEKSFKALVNFHPQVIMGNPGALMRLRAFGFESFGPAIDERYDDEPDPRRRFDMAYAEIRRLCGLEEGELVRLEEELAEVIVHNARWGLVDLPQRFRNTIDPDLVTQLLAACPEKAHSVG